MLIILFLSIAVIAVLLALSCDHYVEMTRCKKEVKLYKLYIAILLVLGSISFMLSMILMFIK